MKMRAAHVAGRPLGEHDVQAGLGGIAGQHRGGIAGGASAPFDVCREGDIHHLGSGSAALTRPNMPNMEAAEAATNTMRNNRVRVMISLLAGNYCIGRSAPGRTLSLVREVDAELLQLLGVVALVEQVPLFGAFRDFHVPASTRANRLCL